MTDLSPTELKTANQIINAGLIKAADSLSFFMKEKIEFIAHDERITSGHKVLNFSPEKKGGLNVLTTQILGEMKGSCYLIFSEEESDILCKLSLGPDLTEQTDARQEMKNAFLLEIDNIISAAVITQFANILRKNIYGSVPSLRKLQYAEYKAFLGQEVSNDLYVIHFETRFISGRMNFCPEFLWLFDSGFVENVRLFATRN
jgi:chemotaxis protein CheY-P-specific phosphatase CheC